MSILLTGERHGFSIKEFFSGTCSPQMLVWLAPLDWSAVRGSRWCAHEESPPPDIPVRDLTFSDLALTRQDEFEAKFAGQDDNKAELWTVFRSLDYIDVLGKLDGIPVSQLDDRQAMIIVDMDATDAVIVTAFSRWLKRARARKPATTSKRERPAYKEWASYGLLPYLDLLQWSMLMGTQIPHHIMAEAVGYRKGGDSFRKTVPKLAKDLMQSLSELEALAAIETYEE